MVELKHKKLKNEVINMQHSSDQQDPSSLPITPLKPPTLVKLVEAYVRERNEIIRKITILNKPNFPKDKIEYKESLINSLEEVTNHILTLYKQIRKPHISGMTYTHSLAMTKASMLNKIITIWRPINKEAANLLSDPNKAYKGKGLNTKGKSSEFGPIAGDIPFEAGLSKLAIGRAHDIEEFNHKNQKVVDEDTKTYKNIEPCVSPANVDDINKMLLLRAIPKLYNTKVNNVDEEKEVYYFQDRKKNIKYAEQTNPQFAVKANHNNWLFYNYNTKQFDTIKNLPKKWKPKKVKIMSYIEFKFVKGIKTEVTRPITADYDELVSAAEKPFPIHHQQHINVELTQALYSALMTQSFRTVDERVKFAAELIMSFEKKEKEEHRTINTWEQHPNMGAVNEEQLALKTHLSLEVDQATNHGPETNNPNPEPFVEGNYPAFMPDGSVQILNNEKEICEFINNMREKGYPLDVNPKWGWELKTTTRQLYIPNKKIDWLKIKEEMELLFAACEEQDKNIIELFSKYKLQNTTFNRTVIVNWHENTSLKLKTFPQLEYLNNESTNKMLDVDTLSNIATTITDYVELKNKYNANKYLINMGVKAIRLTLEPDIYYSGITNVTTDQPYSPSAQSSLKELTSQVGVQINKMELESREEEIKRTKDLLSNKEKQYYTTHHEPSILKRYTPDTMIENTLKRKSTYISNSAFNNQTQLTTNNNKPNESINQPKRKRVQ
jgi:hypothetical protein